MPKNRTATTIEEYFDALEEPFKSRFINIERFIRHHAPTLPRTFEDNTFRFGEYKYLGEDGYTKRDFVLRLKSMGEEIHIQITAKAKDKKQYIIQKWKHQMPHAITDDKNLKFTQTSQINFYTIKSMLKECMYFYRHSDALPFKTEIC